MSLRLAAHWTAVTSIAAIAYTAASIPFTGTPASIAGTLTAAVVCQAGITLAPTTRKDRT